MYIQITKTDCVKIVNENLHGGGSKNSDLEIALAKKCLALYEKLGTINNERNEFFEAIYSASVTFEKATKGALKSKRVADLASMSKAHIAAASNLDSERHEILNQEPTKEESNGT